MSVNPGDLDDGLNGVGFCAVGICDVTEEETSDCHEGMTLVGDCPRMIGDGTVTGDLDDAMDTVGVVEGLREESAAGDKTAPCGVLDSVGDEDKIVDGF